MQGKLKFPPLPTVERLLVRSIARDIGIGLFISKSPRYNPADPMHGIHVSEYGAGRVRLQSLFDMHRDRAFRVRAGEVIRLELAAIRKAYGLFLS